MAIKLTLENVLTYGGELNVHIARLTEIIKYIFVIHNLDVYVFILYGI